MKYDAVVSIVEIDDLDLVGVETFTNDDDGIKQAKQSFIDKAVSRGATEAEAKEYLEDDGYYETGQYQLYIKV